MVVKVESRNARASVFMIMAASGSKPKKSQKTREFNGGQLTEKYQIALSHNRNHENLNGAGLVSHIQDFERCIFGQGYRTYLTTMNPDTSTSSLMYQNSTTSLDSYFIIYFQSYLPTSSILVYLFHRCIGKTTHAFSIILTVSPSKIC